MAPGATHRVAPTPPACSRVRWPAERRGAPAYPPVGAVREPPLQRPSMSWSKRSDAGRRPTHGFKGTAPSCPYTTGKRPWLRRSCTLPAGSVGATRWVARRGRGARAPGMMRGRRARSHQGDAPRRPYMHRVLDPHPALRAGLSLPRRGVSLLLRWKQPAAFCPLPQRSKPFRQAM